MTATIPEPPRSGDATEAEPRVEETILDAQVVLPPRDRAEPRPVEIDPVELPAAGPDHDVAELDVPDRHPAAIERADQVEELFPLLAPAVPVVQRDLAA